jgi:hypothetical protein
VKFSFLFIIYISVKSKEKRIFFYHNIIFIGVVDSGHR